MSSAALVDHLDRTQTVAIITTRANGTEVATPIWSWVVDGVVYLRSVYGARAGWFVRGLSGRPTTFSLADGRLAERDAAAALETPRSEPVTLTRIAADDPVQAAVDAGLRAKYAAFGADLESMLVVPATECTVRVNPA